MSKRGTVTDYAGEPLYKGDLINYATRCGNRVRASDAVIEQVTTIKIESGKLRGKVVPMLKVRPTGVDSGYGLGERQTLTAQWVSPEHARLLRSNVTGQRSE